VRPRNHIERTQPVQQSERAERHRKTTIRKVDILLAASVRQRARSVLVETVPPDLINAVTDRERR
jgi:hypothetical protein